MSSSRPNRLSPTVKAVLSTAVAVLVVAIGLTVSVAFGPNGQRTPITVPVEDPYSHPAENPASSPATGIIHHNGSPG